MTQSHAHWLELASHPAREIILTHTKENTSSTTDIIPFLPHAHSLIHWVLRLHSDICKAPTFIDGLVGLPTTIHEIHQRTNIFFIQLMQSVHHLRKQLSVPG